jgi:thiamine pyrophosphokinase
VDIEAEGERTIVVVAGGAPLAPRLRAVLAGVEPEAMTIAADSGIDLALELGRTVAVAVGDFDSVTPTGMAAVVEAGAEVVRHPITKDATDLELALDVAVARGADRITVVGGHGGRLDHLLANVAVVSSPRYARVRMAAHLGDALVTILHGSGELHGSPGELVTLLPQHGPAIGVTTAGLAYPLRDEDLAPGTSRGVSNLLTGQVASVRLRAGIVAAIQPDHHAFSE